MIQTLDCGLFEPFKLSHTTILYDEIWIKNKRKKASKVCMLGNKAENVEFKVTPLKTHSEIHSYILYLVDEKPEMDFC
jgi:hypothetical protein